MPKPVLKPDRFLADVDSVFVDGFGDLQNILDHGLKTDMLFILKLTMLALSTGIACTSSVPVIGVQAATFHNPDQSPLLRRQVRVQRNIVNGTNRYNCRGCVIATPQPYK